MDFNELFPVGTYRRMVKKVSVSDTVTNRSKALEEFMSTAAFLETMTQLAVEILDHKLPEGFVSVGVRSEVHNLAPAVLGDDVTFTVTVDRVEGNRMVLSMKADDPHGPVATGLQERVVVSTDLLEKRVWERFGGR